MIKPVTGVWWPRQPGVKYNLRLLAAGAVPISHEGLNSLSPWRSVAHLRDLLMAFGTVPRTDRYVIQFERWLSERLATIEDPARRRLLERFATWELLHRLRLEADRRPLNWDRINTARATLLRTMDFLDWLGQRGRTPAQCTQADLDAWFAANQGRLWAVDRMCLFLRWAMEQQVMNRLQFTRPEGDRRAPLSQRQRVALLRQVLASDELPLLERVAALLVLLYAQPISRIVRLTLNDVIRDEAGECSIRLGEPPSPVPNPFAELLPRYM